MISMPDWSFWKLCVNNNWLLLLLINWIYIDCVLTYAVFAASRFHPFSARSFRARMKSI